VNRAAAAFCAAALAAGCARRHERVVVGVSLTGGAIVGAELAVRDIGAAGGVRGLPLELMRAGTSGRDILDPAEVIASARRFADTEDLLAVVGGNDSSTTLAAAGLLEQRGVPFLVTSATHPAVTQVGPHTYRLCPSDAAQASSLARYAVEKWGKRRLAIFFVGDDYGWALAQLFEARARRLGAEVVSAFVHHNILSSEDEGLIAADVSRLAASASPPDLVVLLQRPGAGLVTLRAMREAGLAADVLCGDSLSVPSFGEAIAATKANVRVSTFLDPDPRGSKPRAFAARYRALAGTASGYEQAFAYDAVTLVADAVRANGSSREAVARHLEDLVRGERWVAGVGGSFTFGADHDARRPLFIFEPTRAGPRLLDTIRLR